MDVVLTNWYGWAPMTTAVNKIIEEDKKMRAAHAAKQLAAKQQAK